MYENEILSILKIFQVKRDDIFGRVQHATLYLVFVTAAYVLK